MDRIKVRVNAKVNLTLDVVGRYGEGYHELDMVMASVGVYDEVECIKSGAIRVRMGGRPSGESNTAYKAARLCYDRYGVGLIDIDIKKGIPFSAGMGGSSADAAAVLYCIGKLYGLTYEQLYPIACEVGSDVAFMLSGGIMRARGKGDDLERLPYRDYCLVIVKGRRGCSTEQVFSEYDGSPVCTSYTAGYISAKNMAESMSYIGNALQMPAITVNPDISAAISELGKYSSYVSMTGSGAAVFAVVADMDSANNIVRRLKRRFVFCKACKVLDYGIKMTSCQ